VQTCRRHRLRRKDTINASSIKLARQTCIACTCSMQQACGAVQAQQG
jgi:hypothetical protein